jgi:hypothetical protein
MYELREFAKQQEHVYPANIKQSVKKYSYNFPLGNGFYNDDKFSSYAADPINDPFNMCKKLNLPEEECVKFRANSQAYNEKIQEEYEKSGSKKSVNEWYADWSQTEKGKAITGVLKAGFSTLWDKIFGSSDIVETPDDKDEPKKILGMRPLVFGIVSLVTVTAIVIVIVKLAK